MAPARIRPVDRARTRKSRRHIAPAAPAKVPTSDDSDVLGLLALAALRNVELDVLAFVEGLVSVTLNCGEVNEHVFALLAEMKP